MQMLVPIKRPCSGGGNIRDSESGPLPGNQQNQEDRHRRADPVRAHDQPRDHTYMTSALDGGGVPKQGCQRAKFDPFLSLDCGRVEGVGAQSKERKGSNFAA